jgi:hypothetical protein
MVTLIGFVFIYLSKTYFKVISVLLPIFQTIFFIKMEIERQQNRIHMSEDHTQRDYYGRSIQICRHLNHSSHQPGFRED